MTAVYPEALSIFEMDSIFSYSDSSPSLHHVEAGFCLLFPKLLLIKRTSVIVDEGLILLQNCLVLIYCFSRILIPNVLQFCGAGAQGLQHRNWDKTIQLTPFPR